MCDYIFFHSSSQMQSCRVFEYFIKMFYWWIIVWKPVVLLFTFAYRYQFILSDVVSHLFLKYETTSENMADFFWGWPLNVGTVGTQRYLKTAHNQLDSCTVGLTDHHTLKWQYAAGVLVQCCANFRGVFKNTGGLWCYGRQENLLVLVNQTMADFSNKDWRNLMYILYVGWSNSK